MTVENVHGKKFPGFGRCIYCGATGLLKDEHIIPVSLGGQTIIERASCADCEKITSYLDAYLARDLFQRIPEPRWTPITSAEAQADHPERIFPNARRFGDSSIIPDQRPTLRALDAYLDRSGPGSGKRTNGQLRNNAISRLPIRARR